MPSPGHALPSPASPLRIGTLDLARIAIDAALQPIVATLTGEVFGYEALMRGFNRLGFASPSDLLDHMHETDRLLALEGLVQRRALAHFRTAASTRSRLLFINADGRLLAEPGRFCDSLLETLAAWSVPPTSLCIELPETLQGTQTVQAGALIARLHSEGIRVAIDDLGMGSSDLRLLCDHGVDFIKIDRHFVAQAQTNSRKRALISSITDMAHLLGARVVAEGVETEDEYLVCLDAGCDLVQGYFIAHPSVAPSDMLPAYPKIEEVGSRRRRTRRNAEYLVRSELLDLPTIRYGGPFAHVFDLFAAHPQQSYFPVVDDTDTPLGIIYERDIKKLVYSDFGRDLARNKSVKTDISLFMRAAPVAEIGASAGHLLDLLASSDMSEALLMTEGLRYCGVLSSQALLKIMSERKISVAQDRNPLSGLPGNMAIADFVTTTIAEGGQTRLLCYFDFNHFKPFNDSYGFPIGDKAILLFARLLQDHLARHGHFIAHIGGDDFFAGMTSNDPDEAATRLRALLADFADRVAELYTPEHRAAGGLTGLDRSGREVRFPLMRCSCAVLDLPPGWYSADSDSISRLMAEVKTEAKHAADGLAWHRPLAAPPLAPMTP